MFDSRDRVLIHRYRKKYNQYVKLHGDVKAREMIEDAIKKIIDRREVDLNEEVDKKAKQGS